MATDMKSNLSNMWRSQMPHGLDLEITQHPLTMKSVVNLIIAMERFKGSQPDSPVSTEFRDENLLNIMLEHFVEERHVCDCYSTPPANYSRQEESQHEVCDGENKSLVQVPNSMKLHAVMLQGGVEPCTKVKLNMATYLHFPPSTEALPVALSIKNTDLYLSCCKDGDTPTLQLEKVENKDTLTTISPDSDNLRFLFYKQLTGLNNSTFMSVPFNNWYISTAEENNEPVTMCQEDDTRIRNFKILPLKDDCSS